MNKNRKLKGFTLIEALVVTAVFGLIWGVIMQFIVMVYRTQGYAMDQSMAINEARKGVEVMAKEIRQARYADNGAYPIEKGSGKEFIFYSDIDSDGHAERVRYYLATVNSGSQTLGCSTTDQGGVCNVVFANFLHGTLKTAQVQVSVEGDLGTLSTKHADVSADGVLLGTVCQSGTCGKCSGSWQGTQTYNVATAAADGTLQISFDASDAVKANCSWGGAHTMKAQVIFTFTEEVNNADNQLKKGVIRPSGSPAVYSAAQENLSTISSYVRNAPPVFTYYDGNGNQITDDPAILRDTKMMKLDMIVDVDPNRSPNSYDLEQWVQMRNLKNN